MSALNLDLTKRYTFADYLTWIDDKRRELIGGFVKLMSPAPKRIHQKISSNFVGLIWGYLRDKPCQVWHAPFDVRFPEKGKGTANDEIYTVVQPDLCVVCDLSKLDDRGCLGAPDFIIEILSKGNSKHDVETKFRLYEENGVREYWIVHPEEQTVTVFVLGEDEKYHNVGMYAQDSKVKVNIFDDFHVDLAEVFAP